MLLQTLRDSAVTVTAIYSATTAFISLFSVLARKPSQRREARATLEILLRRKIKA